MTARDLGAAERTRDLLPVAHALQCDLTDPASVRRCAAQAGELLGHVDVLVNNGAAFLAESQVDDDAIVRTILSGTAGTVLTTGSFLPLLRRSERPDVVTLVSLEPDFDDSDDAARDGVLTAQSVADCVLFAVNQPRNCFIRSFHFEPMPRRGLP